MTQHNQQVTQQSMIFTREFDAPRDRVWRAWTDPEAVARWWGQNPGVPAQIDLRVGGKYLFCFHGPDDSQMWSTGRYVEIMPPERLVMTDSFSDAAGNIVPARDSGWPESSPDEFTIIVELEDINGRTRQTLTHVGIPAELHEIMVEAWEHTFDHLEQYLNG